jgi:hypothetical protein
MKTGDLASLDLADRSGGTGFAFDGVVKDGIVSFMMAGANGQLVHGMTAVVLLSVPSRSGERYSLVMTCSCVGWVIESRLVRQA